MSEIEAGAADTGADVSADTGAADSGGGDSGERVSTNAVAASVLEDLEEDQAESSDTGTPAPEQTAEAKAATEALSDEEQLLHEFGFKYARRPDGSEHRIARSKVLKMLGSGLKRGQARWDGERTSLSQERDQLRGHMDEFRADVTGDPRAFLEKLSAYDTRYKAFLEPAQPAKLAAPDAEMPQPDIQLQDGSRTYSLDGLQKLLAWNTQRVEAKVEERLKPWQERDQQEAARRQAEQADLVVRDRAKKSLKEAESWPLFGTYDPKKPTEIQTAILTELQADKSISLHGAYMKVVGPRLVADRNKMREELLKETSAAARSTPTVGRTTEGVPKAAGPRSTREIAAEVAAQLERGA